MIHDLNNYLFLYTRLIRIYEKINRQLKELTLIKYKTCSS